MHKILAKILAKLHIHDQFLPNFLIYQYIGKNNIIQTNQKQTYLENCMSSYLQTRTEKLIKYAN